MPAQALYPLRINASVKGLNEIDERAPQEVQEVLKGTQGGFTMLPSFFLMQQQREAPNQLSRCPPRSFGKALYNQVSPDPSERSAPHNDKSTVGPLRASSKPPTGL